MCWEVAGASGLSCGQNVHRFHAPKLTIHCERGGKEEEEEEMEEVEEGEGEGGEEKGKEEEKEEEDDE